MQKQLICLFMIVSLICAMPGIGLAASDQYSGPLSDAQLQKLMQDLTPPSKIVLPEKPAAPAASPVVTFGTPTAYGANWGQAFIGVSGIHHLDNDTKGGDDTDGSMSVGMGFGNAETLVGVEAYASIISMRSDFGDSGSVGAKIHKIVPGTGGLAVAMGFDNAVTWGDADDAEETIFAVVSRNFILPGSANLPLSVSLGAGSGTFRIKHDIEEDDDNDANVFGSLGLTITPQFSVASSWTGSQLNAGFGFVPFPSVPLSLSAGFGDVTEEYDEGATFMMNVGYSMSF